MEATVVVPTTGDRGPLLPFSVGSILSQSVADLEVFILGDGVTSETRSLIQDLLQSDPRIRFFDHPKDERRGEQHRHVALKEARGRIVCYLCDRDLMLPHHVEEMLRVLHDRDFGHTLRFDIREDGSLGFRHTVDINHPEDRARLDSARLLAPLSFVGHTLEAYRRLPFGWRTTPTGIETDRYMWTQFLSQAECTTATSTRPTILYFKRGNHPGWPTERRLEELRKWTVLAEDPSWVTHFEESVRDAAIRNRGELVRPRPAPVGGGPRARRLLKNSATALVSLSRRFSRVQKLRSSAPHISDVAVRRLGPDFTIEAYWVNEPVGPGPAASLYAQGDEIMRLDCFGGSSGHMHVNMAQVGRIRAGSARLYFEPGTMREHMERGGHELENNVTYAIRTNASWRIRQLVPPSDQLRDASRWIMHHWTAVARAKGHNLDR